MKILALGIGKIGAALLKDYAWSDEVTEVVAGDINVERLERFLGQLGSEKIRPTRIDVADQEAMVELMRGNFDVVASTLPVAFSVRVIKAAIKAGVNYTDVNCIPFPWELHEPAKKAEVTIVPSIGLDPGIDKVMEGYGARKLDKTNKIHFYCGGIPQKGTSAYNNLVRYKITWDWALAIDSYFGFPDLKGVTTGKVPILLDGKIVEIDELSSAEIIEFPEPFGKLEAFPVGVPLDTIKALDLEGVAEAWDKTLRWPGHCEIWRKLSEFHLLDREPIVVKGCKVTPKDVFVEIGNKYLQYEKGEGDAVVLKAEMIGERNGKPARCAYEMTDFYDPETDTTAMGRTTAFPCSIVSQMIARGEIAEKGVLHPSKIGWNVHQAERFFSELARRRIYVNESMTTLLG